MTDQHLFALKDVVVRYKQVPVLYKVSLSGQAQETIGIVGESGSGKSTLAKTLIGLQKPTEGQVFFSEMEVYNLTSVEKRFFRKQVQIVFQDPDASMNPRRTAGWHLLEALTTHFPTLSSDEQKRQIDQVLYKVQLDRSLTSRYSYELSGGQKQRLSLAKALLVHPKFIILDEPLSSLDAALRKSTLSLLSHLQEEFGIAYLFISHDLALLGSIAHHIAVIYRGVIVEYAPTSELYKNPLHPYTKLLLACIPIPNPRLKKEKSNRIHISKHPPLPVEVGCALAHRCLFATELCKSVVPKLQSFCSNRAVACHYTASLPN